jgi:hypothetical protein
VRHPSLEIVQGLGERGMAAGAADQLGGSADAANIGLDDLIRRALQIAEQAGGVVPVLIFADLVDR